MKKIKLGILGYGNLARGIEVAINQNEDMELIAIFSRRNPENIRTLTGAKVFSIDEIENWKDKIDVLMLCGGSATDIPIQGPKYAGMFNTIDSFDTHSDIPGYFKKINEVAKKGEKLSIISLGWDPGLFSLNRLYAEAFLPQGNTYTFWGKGVSQGHSDAIRRIDGVKNGIQYTIPVEEAINKVRNGENPELTTRQKHIRECFVVLEEYADKREVELKIKAIPKYFDEYETIVHFITEEELKEKHGKMPHGGFVIRSGKTGLDNGTNQIIEYSLKLESNPEFTASVLVAYARALYKLYNEGQRGAKTIFDITPNLLLNKTQEEILNIL